MRVVFRVFIIVIFLVVATSAWLVFAGNTAFNGKLKHLYIYPYSKNYEQQIQSQLDSGKIIDNVKVFRFLAARFNVYKNVTPGRFTVKKGTSVYGLLKILLANKQDTVHFTIKRVRTLEGFAGMLGKNFIADSVSSLQFLRSNDSLKPFGVDTFTFISLLIPGTYEMKWQYTIPQILSVFQKEKENFWQNNHRTERAAAQGLTPEEATTLASIVEDETLKDSEKDTIASVYLNRLKINMPLAADPTIKFALRNFNLKRILLEELKVQSPYNTYVNKGLPPGPICTPDSLTIEAVLNAPKTNYLYFVAKPDFSGYHDFSTDYQSHLQKAKAYQEALDERNIK
ncbi:MAG: endolytic transglycosylase MltG [Arachidicoccus sp.]|nr:endolytic transglycosylase MltG [Arachidicoccus sp.]